MYSKAIKIVLSAMMLFAFQILQAQTTTTGDITGVVTDASGAVVPSASVSLKSSDNGSAQTASTNGQGVYRFTLVSPGTYTVSAASAGLQTDTSRITVQVGQVANVNLIAKVQSTTTTVEVTTAVEALQTENADLSRTYSAQQIQNLPAPGGDITTVAFTVPGVVVNTGGGYGNFSTHGLPGTANLFTINGNDYNDPYLNLNNSGASNLLLGQNEISEASVVLNAYSVQYGRNAGAQVNFVTKSGSNALHGNLNYNYNGSILNANDFFNNVNGLPRPHAVSNQWGASIGGPAIKNKLFFFADAEGLRYVLPTSGYVATPSPQFQSYVLGNVSASQVPLYQQIFSAYGAASGKGSAPTAGGGPLQDPSGNLGCGDFAGTAYQGGTFGTTIPCALGYAVNANNLNREWLMTQRVDYNISDKEKVYFRFKTDHGVQATGTNLLSPQFNVDSVQPQYEGQINLTSVISPSVVNNFIGSVLWYSALFTSPNLSSVESTLPFNVYIANGGISADNGFYQAGFGYGGIGYDVFPQGRNSGQLGLSDDLSLIKGKHTLKVGFNVRKNDVSDYTLNENAHGTYQFFSLTDFANGQIGNGDYYTQAFAPVSTTHIFLYNYGLYAQDEWNFKDNIKITYGVRFEHTANPSCEENCFSRLTSPFNSGTFAQGASIPYNQSIETGLHYAYSNTDTFNADPRIGIVWSPKHSRGTVIRAGGGLFSDLPPGNIVASIFTNQPYLYSATVLGGPVGTTSDPNSVTSSAVNQYNAFKTGFSSGQTLGQLSSTVPGGFTPINFFSSPSQLKTPEYLEWSFELQQPIGSKNVFVATYAGVHGYNLFLINPFVNTSYNANAYPNGFGGLPANSPDPRFNGVSQLQNDGVSNYDGLSVQFRRALGFGLQGQIAYTWSHALDDISSLPGEPFSFNNSLTTLTTPYAKLNYSNSDTDIRHNLVADFLYDPAFKFGNHILGNLLANWTLGGKVYLRSGSPFSAIDVPGFANFVFSPTIGAGGTILATALNSSLPRTCGKSAVSSPCFTASDFAAFGSETGFGNLPRNSFYGPGYFDVDLSLYKNFTIKERATFRVGAQALNVLNHPNFANPSVDVLLGQFGQISSTVSAPTSPYGSFQGSAVSGRVLVISGKFEF